MGDLDAIKASLDSVREQLAAKQAEKKSYLNQAAAITEVYDRMAADKAMVEGYRRSVKEFLREKYDTFKGNLYSESYKVQMEALIDDYDLVIKNIDTNLDRLNTARANYENKAYQCNGPIGYLQSSVNSLVHTIQNWVN